MENVTGLEPALIGRVRTGGSPLTFTHSLEAPVRFGLTNKSFAGNPFGPLGQGAMEKFG
jgi:hypothetical protein